MTETYSLLELKPPILEQLLMRRDIIHFGMRLSLFQLWPTLVRPLDWSWSFTSDFTLTTSTRTTELKFLKLGCLQSRNRTGTKKEQRGSKSTNHKQQVTCIHSITHPIHSIPWWRPSASSQNVVVHIYSDQILRQIINKVTITSSVSNLALWQEVSSTHSKRFSDWMRRELILDDYLLCHYL